jgi:virginiamycin B lyase
VSSSHPGQPSIESVKIHITVPTSAPQSAQSHRAKPYYVSKQTTEAAVTVTPVGGVPYPTTSFSCTAQSCTGSVDAPVGADDFSVSLYAANRISPDTLLSSGVATATILAGTTNTVNVTFDPSVSSVLLSITPASLSPGSAGTATVTVDALDAAGQTIIGPGTYINSVGVPLTIDLSNVDTLLNGSQGHSTTLSSTALSGPPSNGPTQVTLRYDGNPNLGYTKVTATTTVAVNGTLTPTTLLVGASPSPPPGSCSITSTPKPIANFYPVPPNGQGIASVGDSIAAGPDGNLWSSDGRTQMLQISTSGGITAVAIPGASGSSVVDTIAPGPIGGNTVWYADPTQRSVGRVTTGSSPSITVFPVPDIESPNLAEPSAIAAGPDLNMWFDDQGSDYVGNIVPLIASITEYPFAPVTFRSSQGLVVLPSGDLWFVQSGIAQVGHVQISSLNSGSVNVVQQIRPPSAKVGELRAIAASPDGNVWFTEPTSNKVGRINVSAVPVTIDEFTVPTSNARPTGIAPGPDGAIWFTETSAKKIGRIAFAAPAGSTPLEYRYTFALPSGITTGPDCNLWITDQASTGRIARVQF